MNLRSLISPYYLMRHSQRRAMRQAIATAPAQGTLIDIGCGQKPHRDLFPGITRHEGIDFAGYSINKDFIAGSPDFLFPPDYPTHWKLPFPDQSYDHAAALEVFEHQPDPLRGLSEIARVLRPGGHLYLSWPFIFPLHEEPHDHYRYTHHAMAVLARSAGLELVDHWRTGGWIAVVVTLMYPPFIRATAADHDSGKRTRNCWRCCRRVSATGSITTRIDPINRCCRQASISGRCSRCCSGWS